MSKRLDIPQSVQDALFVECRRKCAMCFALLSDWHPKNGQIAHIDRNNSNNKAENLAYLCLEHHNDYDTVTRQTKRYTPGELRTYKAMLINAIRDREVNASPSFQSVEQDSKTEQGLEIRCKLALVERSGFAAAGSILYVPARLSNAGDYPTGIKEARFFWKNETIADYSWGIPLHISTNGEPARPDEENFSGDARFLKCDSDEIFEPGKVYPLVVPLAVRKESGLMEFIGPVLRGEVGQHTLEDSAILELVPVRGMPIQASVSVLQAMR